MAKLRTLFTGLVVLGCAPYLLAAPSVPPIEQLEKLESWKRGVEEADAMRDPLTVACFGDSNTEESTYTVALRRILQACYGDKGPGYATFNPQRGAVPGRPTIERRGTWRDFDTSPGRDTPPPAPYFSPDGFWSESEDSNAAIIIAFGKGRTYRVRIHYRVGPGMGHFSIISGDWEAQRISCEAAQPGYAVSEVLTGEAFRIERITGKIELAGYDAERVVWNGGKNLLEGGAIVHALGNGWGQTSHLAPTDESTFRAFFVATKPDLATILLGTNDMHNSGSLKNYRDNLTTIVDKMQRTAPGLGILLISCPEAAFTKEGFAAEYSAIAREVAVAKGCAFWDWRQVVGTRSRRWSELNFIGDGLHYTQTGGEVLTRLLLRGLNFDTNALTHWPALEPAADTASKKVLQFSRLPSTTLEQIPAALAQQPAHKFYDMDRVAGEVRFGATNNQLAIHARVFDGRTLPSLTAWDGSNLDIYVAAPSTSVVRQFVIRPLSPQGVSRISAHENGQEKPAPTFPHRFTASTPAGYELAALIPFEVLGLPQGATEFSLEAAVVTAPGVGAPVAFSRLFGLMPDGGAFRDASQFATVKVSKP